MYFFCFAKVVCGYLPNFGIVKSMLKVLGIFFNSVYRIFTGKKKPMDTKEVYEYFELYRDSYIKGFDYFLNNMPKEPNFKDKCLRFKLFDFEFILKTEIDPFKEIMSFKTFRVSESETKQGEFNLSLIDSLNINFKIESNGVSNSPSARFDIKKGEGRCYTFGDGQVNDLVKEYKNILEDYLKK